MNFKVSIKGGKELERILKNAPKITNNAMKDQIKESSNLIYLRWKADLVKHNKTRKTYNSITQKATAKRATITSDTGKTDNKPTAAWLDVGTRPHEIKAKNAKFLSFFWPKVGKQMFLKKVNHPGTKANNYLTKAFIIYIGLKGIRFKDVLIRRIKNYGKELF